MPLQDTFLTLQSRDCFGRPKPARARFQAALQNDRPEHGQRHTEIFGLLLVWHLLFNRQEAAHNSIRAAKRIDHQPDPIWVTILVIVDNLLRTAPAACYGHSHSRLRRLIRLGALQKTFSLAAQELLNGIAAHSGKSFIDPESITLGIGDCQGFVRVTR